VVKRGKACLNYFDARGTPCCEKRAGWRQKEVHHRGEGEGKRGEGEARCGEGPVRVLGVYRAVQKQPCLGGDSEGEGVSG